MELKLYTAAKRSDYSFVLIVPYGIETLRNKGVKLIPQVLIVPYGIETLDLCYDCNKFYEF